MNNCILESTNRLEYNQLFEEYQQGCKLEQKIGMEYERIPIRKTNQLQVGYDGTYGICELLRQFAQIDNWDYILDDNEIIGLKKNHDTITLEPGCQFELSLEPQNKIINLKNKIESIDKAIEPLLKEFEIDLLNIGISPISTYKNINLIPKKRYHLMAKYLWGILSDVMMRETAGIQIGIDYSSEEDSMEKFRLANLMMPFMTAMFANSKFRGGVDTGYKSFRALAWLNTDNERCGFATKFSKEMSFKDYIEILLDTPMIFINRKNPIFIDGKITFREFLNKGYEKYYPIIDDWTLHTNLYFPEVRLRNFIEIRNHDCVGDGLEYSIPALYKGIMYSKSARQEIFELLDKYSINEIKELRYLVANYAIHSKIHKYTILDTCKEITEIAYYSLKNNCEDEEKFLEPLITMLKKEKCPTDYIN